MVVVASGGSTGSSGGDGGSESTGGSSGVGSGVRGDAGGVEVFHSTDGDLKHSLQCLTGCLCPFSKIGLELLLGAHSLHNILPHFRQWCFRVINENFFRQIIQCIAAVSGTHSFLSKESVLSDAVDDFGDLGECGCATMHHSSRLNGFGSLSSSFDFKSSL
jgi:hypothetical protein